MVQEKQELIKTNVCQKNQYHQETTSLLFYI